MAHISVVAAVEAAGVWGRPATAGDDARRVPDIPLQPVHYEDVRHPPRREGRARRRLQRGGRFGSACCAALLAGGIGIMRDVHFVSNLYSFYMHFPRTFPRASRSERQCMAPAWA